MALEETVEGRRVGVAPLGSGRPPARTNENRGVIVATSLSRSLSSSVVDDHVPIARFNTYLEAQSAVDYLSDQRFPVQHTMIVGVGLRMVEQILSRMTHLRAAASGALAGAWFGLLAGLFLALFTDTGTAFVIVVLLAMIWGALAGALFGLVSYAMTGGQRDFVSASELVADRYEVLVAVSHAEQARGLLDSRQTGRIEARIDDRAAERANERAEVPAEERADGRG